MSGTLISAQTAVWFGKLVLPRQTRYWYQRGHGGAPGVLRFALRQWYSCEPAASILSASDRKVLVECASSPPIASNSIANGPVMPTVQLDAKPVLLSTYISQQNAAKPAAMYSASLTASFGRDPLPLTSQTSLRTSESISSIASRRTGDLTSTLPD